MPSPEPQPPNPFDSRPTRASLCVPTSPVKKSVTGATSLNVDLSRKIAALPHLDKAQLLKVWAENSAQGPSPSAAAAGTIARDCFR